MINIWYLYSIFSVLLLNFGLVLSVMKLQMNQKPNPKKRFFNWVVLFHKVGSDLDGVMKLSVMASGLDSGSSCPGLSLGWDSALSSWARHFTLSAFLYLGVW